MIKAVACLLLIGAATGSSILDGATCISTNNWFAGGVWNGDNLIDPDKLWLITHSATALINPAFTFQMTN